jgi:3-phenylpropionate/trans-cinnamate dioxygenase ferredoxin reductase component
MQGRAVAYDRVPWFWSDQFDDKLLIVGLSKGHDRMVLRGDPAGSSFSVCYLRKQELLALEAVNHSRDYMAARKLIQERVPLDPVRIADVSIPLKEALLH